MYPEKTPCLRLMRIFLSFSLSMLFVLLYVTLFCFHYCLIIHKHQIPIIHQMIIYYSSRIDIKTRKLADFELVLTNKRIDDECTL